MRVSRDRLDDMVLEYFYEHVLAQARVAQIATALASSHRIETMPCATSRLNLKVEHRDVAYKLAHLYAAIEDGATLDPSLCGHINKRQERRDYVLKLITTKRTKLAAPIEPVSAERAAVFAGVVREHLPDKESPAFARAYLKLVVSEVHVGDREIRITGPKAALATRAAAFAPGTAPVLSFEQ